MTFRMKKLAAVAAALCLICMTCYAAVEIGTYESYSTVDIAEYNQLALAEKEAGFEIRCVEAFSNGFKFDRGGVFKMLSKFDGKDFKSVESEDFATDSNAPSLDKDLEVKIMEVLIGKVVKVKGSSTLKNHPVRLTSEGDFSIEMEKVLSKMPSGEGVKAQKVLEINVNHPIYAKLLQTFATDEAVFKDIVNVMYGQAMLLAGLEVEDVSLLTDTIFKLIK